MQKRHTTSVTFTPRNPLALTARYRISLSSTRAIAATCSHRAHIRYSITRILIVVNHKRLFSFSFLPLPDCSLERSFAKHEILTLEKHNYNEVNEVGLTQSSKKNKFYLVLVVYNKSDDHFIIFTILFTSP